MAYLTITKIRPSKNVPWYVISTKAMTYEKNKFPAQSFTSFSDDELTMTTVRTGSRNMLEGFLQELNDPSSLINERMLYDQANGITVNIGNIVE